MGLLVALLLGSVPVGKKLSKEHKKWLEEEVVYIITNEEKEEFLGLGSDAEREEFIRRFWEKRDPTPGTPENEYLVEHYLRIKLAIMHFKERGIMGWKTDRGKVWIMFGRPDDVQWKFGSDAHIDPSWRRDFKQGRELLIWKYNAPKNPFLGEHPELIFQLTPTGHYALSGVSISKIPPEAAFYRPSIPDEALKKILGEMAEAPPEAAVEEKALQELITSGATKSEIGLELSVHYFPAQPPSSYIPLTLLINNADLSFTKVEGRHRAELSVFGKVLQKEEEKSKEVQSFSLPLQIDYTDEEYSQRGDKSDNYSIGFPLLRGSYLLYLGVWDKGGNRLTTIARELEVPDFHKEDKLFTSSILFARKINRLDAVHTGLEKVTKNIFMGKTEIELFQENIFHQSDQPILFFFIAGAGINPQTQKPDIQIEYSIRKGAEFMGRYPPQKYDDAFIIGQFSVAQFTPDNYALEIKITDLVSKQEITTSVKFKVI